MQETAALLAAAEEEVVTLLSSSEEATAEVHKASCYFLMCCCLAKMLGLFWLWMYPMTLYLSTAVNVVMCLCCLAGLCEHRTRGH